MPAPKVIYFDWYNGDVVSVGDSNLLPEHDGYEVGKYVLESTGHITSATRYEPKKPKK